MRRALALLLLVPLVAAGCVAPGDGVAPAASAAEDALGLLPEAPSERVARAVQVDARWSGEPSILAMRDGTLLVTGAGGLTRYAEDPTDAPGNAGQSYLWRSVDDGATWTFVDLGLPAPLSSLAPYRNAVLGVEGDLAEDEAGRAYFVDLAALAANGLSASDDSGASWLAAQNPLVGWPGTDRPWVAAARDGVVFVKYLQLADGHRVARSVDGGLTFLEDVAITGCGQADMTVDLASGRLVVPCVDGDDLFLLRAAVDAPLAFERLDGPKAEGPASNVFVSAAVAREGEVVFAWAETVEGGARVRVSRSIDAGASWSEPVTLSTPERTAVFPWVDANARGQVGVVWYEADAWGPSDEMDAAWWPVHAALRLGEDGALDVLERTRLTAEPAHEGAICLSGLGCVLAGRSDERRLLDFFEVDVDEAGRSHVAWTSTRGAAPTVWYGQVGHPGN